MNWLTRGKKAEDAATENFDEKDLLDPALRQTLSAFKASVDAWSDAALSQPHVVRPVGLHRGRVLVGWGLATALLIGTGATGTYEYHQRQVAALAARQAEEARQRAEEQKLQAQRDEEMFASVDSAISREVPSAMEPLAVLADGDEGNQ